MQNRVLALDVSFYQATVDYRKAASLGVRAVLPKATEGIPSVGFSACDSNLDYHTAGATAAGLQVPVFYHFFRAWCSGSAQAKHVLETLGSRLTGRRVACDLEIPCSLRRVQEFGQAIFDKTGAWPVLYTSPNVWLNLVTGDRDPFVAWPLWQAQWYVAAPQPLYPWKDAHIEPVIWQFSAKGNKRGAEFGASSTDLDLNWIDADWLGVPVKPDPLAVLTNRVERLTEWAKGMGYTE